MKTLLLCATMALSLCPGLARANTPSLRQTEIARALNNRSDKPWSRAYLIQGVAPGQIRVGVPNARGVARWSVDAEKLAAPRSHALVPVVLSGILRQLPPRLGNPAGGVRIRVTAVTPERL
jgi:hypothetical protein